MADDAIRLRVEMDGGSEIEVAVDTEQLERLDDLMERRRRGATLVRSDSVHTSFHGGQLELSVLDVVSYRRLD